jgi:ABC-type taurine transport system ATPase subunit
MRLWFCLQFEPERLGIEEPLVRRLPLMRRQQLQNLMVDLWQAVQLVLAALE